MLLKVCTQCSREEERIKNGDLERNPGYMCPGCDIDIEDAKLGIQRPESQVSLTRNWISTMGKCSPIRQKKIKAQSMMRLMSNQSF